MSTNATFDEVLSELLRTTREAHDNGEVLQGQFFADERGWLSGAQRADMLDRQARAEALEQRVGECLQLLCDDHARAWGAYVDTVLRSFHAVEQGRLSHEGEPPSEAERQLAAILVGAWKELRKGKTGGYGVSWTVQAGVDLANRWDPVSAIQ